MASYATYQRYNQENVSSNVPEKSGCYMLRVKLTSGDWRVYYVGQASNLKSRLLEHLRSTEPNQCIRNHVLNHINEYTWVELGRQQDRDTEEKAKYEKYSPECNRISPPA